MKKLCILLILLCTPAYAIKIVGPASAPVGSPVLLKIEGKKDNSNIKWIKHIHSDDTFLELLDNNKQQVAIFWSNKVGRRRLVLVEAENGDTSPTITYDSYTLDYGSGPQPEPGPGPDPNPLVSLVAYVRATPISPEHKSDLAKFYNQIADMVERSGTLNTGQFKTAYVRTGKEFFAQKDIKGKYVGLASVIDKIIIKELGDEIRTLDKAKTASLMRLISKAFQ